MLKLVITSSALASALADSLVPVQTGYNEAPKPYTFEYGVEDSYSGSSFNQQEASDARCCN